MFPAAVSHIGFDTCFRSNFSISREIKIILFLCSP